jgi:hypothetical protein
MKGLNQMFQDLQYTVNMIVANSNPTSFFIYAILVAILCAFEQYRYFNRVMAQPLLPGSIVD